jgi:hypothetical protein
VGRGKGREGGRKEGGRERVTVFFIVKGPKTVTAMKYVEIAQQEKETADRSHLFMDGGGGRGGVRASKGSSPVFAA